MEIHSRVEFERQLQEDPSQIPTGFLIVVLRREGNTADVLLRCVKELKRREIPLKGWLLARVNKIDPPPCHCGGKGIYIVGHTMFCAKHRADAQKRMQRWRQYLLSAQHERATEFNEWNAIQDAKQKSIKAAKGFK